MKCLFIFLCPIVTLLLLQSCSKNDSNNEIQTDPFTYAKQFNWREDSIKTGSDITWTKVGNGNVFSWLASKSTLQSAAFATYVGRTNIKTNFEYAIVKDSVFVLQQKSDSIFFLDANDNRRADVKGIVSYSPDTSLVLINTAVSPALTIKYKLEK